MTGTTVSDFSLASLVERGGVYYGIPGTGKKELLASVIGLLPPSAALDREALLREILEREALVSTGMGRGIAIPHPRNPAPEIKAPLAAIAFPSRPVDWDSPDGVKVHAFFLLISTSVKQHLGALSKINFLCQQEKFYSLIEARSSKEVIISAIREAEAAWKTELS
ncbi:MAG: PTS sugar transporter subunit IIA [Treponema sp.]|nr:PTS sugar transporter subunit IIA [Treponema sp.]